MLRLEEWVDIRSMRNNGYSIRRIARELGISRNTVKKALGMVSSPKYERKPMPSKLDPFRDYLKKRIEDYDLPATRLLEEIKVMGYTGKISLLRRYLRSVRCDNALAVERFETPPGFQGQCDWSVCGSMETDDGIKKLYAFVMVLSYSRAMYVEFTTSSDVLTLIRCHMHAFEYFGGFPREILYDNMKQVVLLRGIRDGERKWNPKFLDFAGYYGFTPRLCYPYRPQTKGKVERAIGYIKSSFLLGREFRSLDELNHEARMWIDRVANARVHGTTGEIPLERLADENLTGLKTLPRYDTSNIRLTKVSRDAFVSYLANLYSVPMDYVRRAVMLKISEDCKLSVIFDGEIIAKHALVLGKHKQIINPDHRRITRPDFIKRSKPKRKASIYIPKHIEAPAVEIRSLSVYEAASESCGEL